MRAHPAGARSIPDFEELEKLGLLDAPTPKRVASPCQSDCRQREQQRWSEGCSSAASLWGRVLSSRQSALSAQGFSVHGAGSLIRAACISYPRGHGDGTEDVEVGDTSHLTSFSISGEHTTDTL